MTWKDLHKALLDYYDKHSAYIQVAGTPSDFVPEIELLDARKQVMRVRRELGIPSWLQIGLVQEAMKESEAGNE